MGLVQAHPSNTLKWHVNHSAKVNENINQGYSQDQGYVFCIIMHSALFVRDAIFHMLYMSKDIATFKSQKEVVFMTHLWNPKKERKAKA